MNWEFYEKSATDPVRNPIGGEFFSTEAVKNTTDALMREAIQNTLDARITHNDGIKETARLRVYISESTGALSPEKAVRWFGNLWPHIIAKDNGLREQPKLNERCPFIVIEDFGTTGLTGDPDAHEIISETANNFLNFFRAEGHSDKSGEKGGSWGIGKNVFPRASRINSYFGYTARDDDQLLLLGRSIVKFHKVEAKSYKSDGYWGIKRPEDGFMLPVSDGPVLDEFRNDFNLERTTESGLSIVVPWCVSDEDDGGSIGFESVVEAAVRGFFFPILKGILEVDVRTPEKSFSLSAATLLETIELHRNEIPGLKTLIPVIKLAQWMDSVEQEHFLNLEPPDSMKAQKWTDKQTSTETLQTLREGLATDAQMAIQIPMFVRSLNASPAKTHFSIYLERSLESHKPVFIRDELVIPDVKASSIPGVRSLVVITDGPIATLLRRAETPAHTQWSAGTSNFKNLYTFGSAAINFVSASVSSLIGLVNKSEQKPDPSLTIDFFSVSAPPEESESKRKSNRPQPVPGDGPGCEAPIVPAKPKQISIQSRQGGFSIVAGNAEWDSEFTIKAKLAYDVRRGSPLKRYNPADFDVSKMRDQLILIGAEVIEAANNEIRLKVLEPEFNISMNGFDVSRDIYLNVRTEKT